MQSALCQKSVKEQLNKYLNLLKEIKSVAIGRHLFCCATLEKQFTCFVQIAYSAAVFEPNDNLRKYNINGIPNKSIFLKFNT